MYTSAHTAARLCIHSADYVVLVSIFMKQGHFFVLRLQKFTLVVDA